MRQYSNNSGRKMALDGQVSYLSTESPVDFPRPRTPRRSPRLRMNEEDEEAIDNERISEGAGIRAPIIGYEVIDQRQKFTVGLRALLFVKIFCPFNSFILMLYPFVFLDKLLKVRLIVMKLR